MFPIITTIRDAHDGHDPSDDEGDERGRSNAVHKDPIDVRPRTRCKASGLGDDHDRDVPSGGRGVRDDVPNGGRDGDRGGGRDVRDVRALPRRCRRDVSSSSHPHLCLRLVLFSQLEDG